MRFLAGQTDVATAGTAVALSSDGDITPSDQILWAQFKADPDNTTDVYVGVADVSASDGFSLENTDATGLIIDPGKYEQTIAAEVIYFDATTNGENVCWVLLLAN